MELLEIALKSKGFDSEVMHLILQIDCRRMYRNASSDYCCQIRGFLRGGG